METPPPILQYDTIDGETRNATSDALRFTQPAPDGWTFVYLNAARLILLGVATLILCACTAELLRDGFRVIHSLAGAVPVLIIAVGAINGIRLVVHAFRRRQHPTLIDVTRGRITVCQPFARKSAYSVRTVRGITVSRGRVLA